MGIYLGKPLCYLVTGPGEKQSGCCLVVILKNETLFPYTKQDRKFLLQNDENPLIFTEVHQNAINNVSLRLVFLKISCKDVGIPNSVPDFTVFPSLSFLSLFFYLVIG